MSAPLVSNLSAAFLAVDRSAVQVAFTVAKQLGKIDAHLIAAAGAARKDILVGDLDGRLHSIIEFLFYLEHN